jgi:Derlin-2/3
MRTHTSHSNKIPPVTRSLVGATCLVSLPTMLKLVSPYVWLLWWPAVVQRWHLWRPITAFFFGPPGLSFIFDLFFLLCVGPSDRCGGPR